MGVLSSIARKAGEVLRAKFPEGGREGDVINEMQDVFIHGLTHVFQQCEALIKQGTSQLYRANLNDYDGSTFETNKSLIVYNSAQQALHALLDATEKMSPNQGTSSCTLMKCNHGQQLPSHLITNVKCILVTSPNIY
jgi:hypothetical protein